MAIVVGVRFKEIGKIYYFDPLDFELPLGQNVIVETSRGTEFGEVVIERRDISEENIVSDLKQVKRLATNEDILICEENRTKEKEAFNICKEKIKVHKIRMNLIQAEYAFDRSKILFYFTADGRVDFRDLVKDLASIFRTRIELRQVGVRDKSKMVGGLGICGKTLCCATFLDDFHPVSINMAKDQGLSLNPVKISGTCGRLMCCLKYEQDVYSELNSHAPNVGCIVKTPEGKGTVLENQILKRTVKVRVEGIDIPKYYDLNDIKVLKSRKNFDNAPSDNNTNFKKNTPSNGHYKKNPNNKNFQNKEFKKD